MEFEGYIGEPDVERLIRAFKREEVDRVPNWENLIEDQHVERILGRHGGNTLAFGGDPAKGIVDPEKVRPMYPNDYIELCKVIGQDAIMIEALWTPFKKEDEDGKVVNVSDRSIKNIQDYRKLKKPSKSDIERILKYVGEYREAVKGTKIGVSVFFGCLMQTFYEFIVGMNDFMMACYEDRFFVEEMLEDSTEYWTKFCKAIVDVGVDFIYPADDVAFKTGLFIPPKLFKEIWVPRYKKILSPAVEAGVPIIFHSDGKIDDIIEDLIDVGVDCINPMDPYSMDYRKCKKKYGKNVSLCGNIDIEFPLSKGTPENVEKDVKQHMDVLKPGYGYIAGSSHSIVNYIPHENFITMINAIHKYGKY